jgi:superfamily I DNA/RNA helicase
MQQKSLALFVAFLAELDKFVTSRDEISFSKINRFIVDSLASSSWQDYEPDEFSSPFSFSFTLERQQVLRAAQTINGIEAHMAENMDSATLSMGSADFLLEIFNSIALSQTQYQERKTLDVEGQAIRCQTVHSFKGLEAPYVFFCHLRQGNKIGRHDLNWACLFYVGVTRATRRLYLSWANQVLSYSRQRINSQPNEVLDYYLGCVEDFKRELNA